MFHSQRDALLPRRKPKRRTSSEGSNNPQPEPSTNLPSTSSQRHSMDDVTSVKRVVLRKYSGEPIPSSRSLAHKIACSEAEGINGFWSRRLSSPKRLKHPDVTPSLTKSISNIDDSLSSPTPLSNSTAVATEPSPIAIVNPRSTTSDLIRVKSFSRPLPRPPTLPPQSQIVTPPPINHTTPIVPNRPAALLKAPIPRSSEARGRTANNAPTISSSSPPSLPPLPFLANPPSFLSEPPPPVPSKRLSQKRLSHRAIKGKDKKRFRHFDVSKFVVTSDRKEKVGAIDLNGTTKFKADTCLIPLNNSIVSSPIYQSRAHAKAIHKQLSERRKRRKTGLAQIVVELAVGAVSQQVESEAIQADDVREILAQLRRLKAA